MEGGRKEGEKGGGLNNGWNIMEGGAKTEGQHENEWCILEENGKLENENEKKIRNVDARFPARGCTGISNKTMCYITLVFQKSPTC